MENTDKLVFKNDVAQWFVLERNHWQGPLKAEEVFRKIQAGDFSWADFAWNKNEKKSDRILNFKEFEMALPTEPSGDLLEEVVKKASPGKPTVRSAANRKPKTEPVDHWFVHYQDQQTGPFTFEEVVRLLDIGRIHHKTFAWQVGMENWDRIERIGVFRKALEEIQRREEEDPSHVETKPDLSRTEVPTIEFRRAIRRPLVARIMMTDQNAIITGMCRDISVGGMQVLTDRVPGDVGSQVRLNVSPTQTSEMKPFVAEGTIVRVLEDGKGFSFRFERLDDAARESIEKYLAVGGEA